MKTLILMRHAKSSWDDASLSDFERPLNERGKATAPFMGKLIEERDIKPDKILSSPAERAKQTAIMANDGGFLDADIEFNENIYEASPYRLLEIITEVGAAVNTLMLVGHNPGMEGLLQLLTGESHSVPTGAVMKISLDVANWSGVHEKSGTLDLFLKPREEMKSV